MRDHDHFDIKMLSCREIVFSEKRSKYKDIRPFRVFHSQDAVLLSHNNLQDYMHFSLSSAIFPLQEFQRQNFTLTLGEGWPCFEDGHSVLRYLKETQQGHVLFCKSPVYYYRKRAHKTSQIDNSPQKKAYYLDVLRDGYLDILQQYRDKLGFVPAFVQRSCVCDMSWRIKLVQGMGRNIPVLSNEEQQEFLSLCDRIFSYIDKETILSFPEELSGFSPKFKLGTVHCFKGEQGLSKIASCDKYDSFKNLFRVSYFNTSCEADCVVMADGLPLQPAYSKVIGRSFLSRTFVFEVHCWFPCPASAKEVSVVVAGERMLLELGGKQKNSFSTVEIKDVLGATEPLSSQESHWVLIDRNDQADDNAEHFYRYLAKSHPEQEIYFGLKKDSHDWNRLDVAGFNLLEYNSKAYLQKLESSSLIASSHLDEDLRKQTRGKPFVFLQHGVTKHDLSQWMNRHKIELFIASGEAEYDSIVSDGSPYNLGRKEVVLTGFPRHDKLLDLQQSVDKPSKILVMPTWRRSLALAARAMKSSSDRLAILEGSVYGQAWLTLLCSEQLQRLSQCFGCEIVFFPHVNMQKVFALAELPKGVTFLSHADTSIQKLMADSVALVTDYSSIAFEMAYLQRPVVYYQFDKPMFFSGSHTFTNGYFDYSRDGFGPVVTSQEALLKELENVLTQKGQVASGYRERMEKAFAFRDGKNCERVYDAIMAMLSPEPRN